MMLPTTRTLISTRAPREGSDHSLFVHLFACTISTRAPREGSDACG